MKSAYDTVKFITDNKGLVIVGAIAIRVIFTISADAGTHNPQ